MKFFFLLVSFFAFSQENLPFQGKWQRFTITATMSPQRNGNLYSESKLNSFTNEFVELTQDSISFIAEDSIFTYRCRFYRTVAENFYLFEFNGDHFQLVVVNREIIVLIPSEPLSLPGIDKFAFVSKGADIYSRVAD